MIFILFYSFFGNKANSKPEKKNYEEKKVNLKVSKKRLISTQIRQFEAINLSRESIRYRYPLTSKNTSNSAYRGK